MDNLHDDVYHESLNDWLNERERVEADYDDADAEVDEELEARHKALMKSLGLDQ